MILACINVSCRFLDLLVVDRQGEFRKILKAGCSPYWIHLFTSLFQVMWNLKRFLCSGLSLIGL